MYQPQPFDNFGAGLNLKSKADAVGTDEAIDLMNVVFTDRGAIEQRDGYTQLTSSALTNAVGSLHPYYSTSGTKQLLAGCGTRLEALNTSGGVVASDTGLTTGTWDFARFGTPNNEYAYAGNGSNSMRRWSGSAWATVANSPKGGSLCVKPKSNRLVCTRFVVASGEPTGGTQASSPDVVYFSDAGAPETWTSTSWVTLTPGDGEKIQACVSWRDYVIIFKESKFFVFTEESTDVDGLPVFNYYTVDTGVGAIGPLAVTATEDGVYFVGRNGLYVTTGDAPEKLSDPVDPIFLGGSSDYFTGGELSASLISSVAVGNWREQIFIAYSQGGSYNDRTLVYDTTDGWWSLWNLPATSFATFRPSSTEDLVFGYSTGSNDVGQMNENQTNDDGSATTSYWRGGFQDFGSPENKAVRQQKIWGSGKVFCAVSSDYAVGTGTNVALDFSDPSVTTWGGSTWGGGSWSRAVGLNVDHRRVAIRGTQFSTYFYNAILNQSWSVHRLEHHIRGARQTTVKKTEVVY